MPSNLRLAEAHDRMPMPMTYRMPAESSKGRDFLITRRWFGAQYLFMLAFCIGWDAFLVFWYMNAAMTGSLLMSIFPIAHVAVGIALSYTTLAGLLNRTTIAVRQGQLSIRHGPLPWLGNIDISAQDIKQLFCEQKLRATKSAESPQIAYTVSAVLASGEKKVLLRGLPEADQALFIEQEIETRLGIVDEPVGGQYTGLPESF
jgi:hypothetical protein